MTAQAQLERPNVLVSGGSRGLGASITRSLLEDGHAVATFSRKRTGLCDELEQTFGQRFLFAEGDMADKASLRSVVKASVERFGRLDALVNNAGVADDGVLAMFPENRIDRLMSINLTGALALTRLFVRHFIGGTPEEQSRGAAIVNISSIVGIRGYRGLSAYAATKSGMLGMTYALARELGDRGVRVNAICPGYLETEMTHGLDDVQRRQIVNRTPLGRLGTPDDVAGVVRFLLSRDSSFMTGQSIVVDGGITC